MPFRLRNLGQAIGLFTRKKTWTFLQFIVPKTTLSFGCGRMI